jgi:hypothetical protein
MPLNMQIATDVYVLFKVSQSEFITYTASSLSGVMFDGLAHGLSGNQLMRSST